VKPGEHHLKSLLRARTILDGLSAGASRKALRRTVRKIRKQLRIAARRAIEIADNDD